MVTYSSTENRKCYFPPLLANEEISFAPDAEGMLGYTVGEFRDKGVDAFDGIVVRAARRSALCHKLNARLFPFGKFTFNEGSGLKEWSQSLCAEEGYFESKCSYEDGVSIKSKGFIHPKYNIYALQKTFEGVGAEKRVSYEVKLTGYNKRISDYMNVLYTKKRGVAAAIGFKMWGLEIFTGEINAFVDKDFDMEEIENGVRISFNVKDSESVTFYYCLEDDMGENDFAKTLRAYRRKIHKCAFSGLLAECREHFAKFYNSGYVKTADERLNSIYNMSLYNIKCNTNKYSIAVGYNNGSWDGKYFAFDEYTSYLGLLTSNRIDFAKRVPEYRLASCDVAIKRGSDLHVNEYTEPTARYHWETGEVDVYELAGNGCYQDHVFHMPLIALGAFNFYEYSQDKAFLAKCYKMIRACAKYFTRIMIYKDADKYYIGKCTDLERLGTGVERAFMTTAGAIKLLECCAKVAKILKVDKEYAKECTFLAKKLRESLPVEENRYVPCPKCRDKSVAVFSGKFPFDVLAEDDEKMLNAWDDFEENGAAYGNMYPWGANISAWYAAWKALAYTRSALKEKAYDSLKQAYNSVGVFDEMFEINEEVLSLRPWFSTAAGTFVAATNEMLLKSEKGRIKILPAFPHNIDVSFKLAAKGGAVVEAEVKGGELVKIKITNGGRDVSHKYKIEF